MVGDLACYGGDTRKWYGSINSPSSSLTLPFPGYIATEINTGMCTTSNGDGWQQEYINFMGSALWGYYCTPDPPTPWQPISTGPMSLDVVTEGDVRSPTTNTFTLYQGHAIACRFYPRSRFIPDIIVHNVLNLVSGKKTVVEIRSNDATTGLLVGAPGDNNILAKISTIWPVLQSRAIGGPLRTISQ